MLTVSYFHYVQQNNEDVKERQDWFKQQGKDAVATEVIKIIS